MPVLIDAELDGRARHLIVNANRNGFYYVLDRVTGEFVRGQASASRLGRKDSMPRAGPSCFRIPSRATKVPSCGRTQTEPPSGSVHHLIRCGAGFMCRCASGQRLISSARCNIARGATFPAAGRMKRRRSMPRAKCARWTRSAEICAGAFRCFRRRARACCRQRVDWFLPELSRAILLR